MLRWNFSVFRRANSTRRLPGWFARVTGQEFSRPTHQVRSAINRTALVLFIAMVLAACGGEAGSPDDTGTEASTVTTSVAPSSTEGATTTTTGATTTTTAAPSTTAAQVTTTTNPPTPVPETTTTQDDPATVSPEIEGLGPEISAQIWEAAEIAEGIRGLEFEGLPSIVVLSPEDFEERVRAEVESELEDIEVDEALFKLLGLLEPDDDLAALYGELYGESVAGFYSSEDRELVIPASGEEFTGIETLTLLHELVHALTDQHFDFGPRMEELVDSQLFDPASALVALVEGDATLSEIIYVNNLDVSERNRLMAEFADYQPPDIDIPLFMELALYFPYEQGFEYVLNRWREGGWRAVDALYLEPPDSTEEIFAGEPSPSTEPIEMERPTGALPDGYEEIYDYTWGFLDILIMFQQVLGPDVAVEAATGWGGGRSLIGYDHQGEVVLVWEHAGDSPEETEELALLLADYAAAGMNVGELQTGEDLWFSASGEDYVVVAPIPVGLVMVACSDPQVCPSVAASYLR